MDLNATLLVQMLAFIAFVLVTMKFIWPPLMQAMEERRQKIADGLAAADEGQKDLIAAQEKSNAIIEDAKTQASHIVEQANMRALHIVEEAKNKAREEGERLLKMAQDEIAQEYQQAKTKLLDQVVTISMLGAEKILRREINPASNSQLVNDLVGEL